jgi:hypothetical protein
MSLYLCPKNIHFQDNSEIISINELKQIFITGSTGTVGKAILEKLLYDQVTNNKSLYIIHNFIRSPINSILKILEMLKERHGWKETITDKNESITVHTNKVHEFTFYKIKWITIGNTNIFYQNYNIGYDGLEDDLFLEKKFLEKIKSIAGKDNPQIQDYPNLKIKFENISKILDKKTLSEEDINLKQEVLENFKELLPNKNEEFIKNIKSKIIKNPESAYKQNKEKACSYILINSVMDKDAQAVRINMNGNKITDVRKHWSIKLAAQISKVTNYHFIKLIHISTVYVNKGIVPVLCERLFE